MSSINDSNTGLPSFSSGSSDKPEIKPEKTDKEGTSPSVQPKSSELPQEQEVMKNVGEQLKNASIPSSSSSLKGHVSIGPQKEHNLGFLLSSRGIIGGSKNASVRDNLGVLAPISSLNIKSIEIGDHIGKILEQTKATEKTFEEARPELVTELTIRMKKDMTLNKVPYGANSSTVEKVRQKDAESLQKASTFFSTKVNLSEDHPPLSAACKNLIQKSEMLFTNPSAFKSLWSVFIRGNEDLKSFENINEKTFDLNGNGYHNIGHAQEMFYDTYEKLAEKGYPESTCMAGATMAFFHDLVQGLDKTIPTLGINEDVTARFLKFLLNPGNEKDNPAYSAIGHLADSTILGGTFLIKVLENDEEKNKTVGEVLDYSQFEQTTALDILKTIRETLAENDISRTVLKSIDEPVVITDSKVKANLETIKILKSFIDKDFANNLKKSRIAQLLYSKYEAMYLHEYGEKNAGTMAKNIVSRLFQSIRMLTEFPVRDSSGNIIKPQLNRNEVVKNFANRDTTDPIDQRFIDKLKNAKTWTNDKFAESSFARQSDHEAYAQMVDSPVFVDMMTKLVGPNLKGDLIRLDNDDIKDLIVLALKEGQDGSKMFSVSSTIDNQFK